VGRIARGHAMTWRPTSTHLAAIAWLALAAGQTARVVATGSLMSGDGVYHFAHLHSIVVDRDLDPVNEIRYFRQQARSPYTGQFKIGNRPPRHPSTGEVVNKYPIGLALLTLPAYVTVYAVSHGLAAAGVPADVSGYGWTYQYFTGLLIAAYAVLGLWCCQRVATARDVTASDGWWATLLVAGATPWLFYATLEPLFSHALSATGTAVLVWQWLRARTGDRPSPWCVTGIVAGLAATVRYQDALLLVIPALDLLASRNRRPREVIVCGLALGAGALVGVLPQLAVNYHLFGNPLATGYFGEGFTHWRSPGLLYTLTSADVGLVRWAPIVAPALAGLVIGAHRGWPHARIGLVYVALQIYIVGSWFFLSQGHAFGNRMLVSCTVFFVVGLAGALAHAGTRPQLRASIRAAGVFLVGVNLLLMWLWSRGVIGPVGRLG
jgi:hypothetical protein